MRCVLRIMHRRQLAELPGPAVGDGEPRQGRALDR
jgi:hypothetical protein